MLTGHMRFVFNGIEDLRPIVKNMGDAELRALLDHLPHRKEEEIWDDCMRVTDNQSDQEMLQVHVTESIKTIHWLAGKGHDWVPVSTESADNILVMNGGGYGLQHQGLALPSCRHALNSHQTTRPIDIKYCNSCAAKMNSSDNGRVRIDTALSMGAFSN